jgi:5-methylcytosine-specific restriction endonuclease McrA
LAHAGRVKAEYTAEDLVALWHSQQGKCAITGARLIPGDNVAIDHIVPIAKNGNGTIENVRFVHVIFNHFKWNLSDSELKAFLKDYGPQLMDWSNLP